jgi:thiol-disulfide isomerase/thioredoxin
MPEIVLRLLEAFGLVGFGWLAFRLANTMVLIRATRAATNAAKDAMFQTGRPAVLYFTTPDCVACKAFQRPQLNRFSRMLGEQVQVVEIDAQSHPDLAGRWGVLSVPTTFVLDASGVPRHVNHGAVSAEKLAEQIYSFDI